ncbi:SNW/SKI-interacting protein [Galdieria sulphuraria]|uniref:SKI-interacting protein SKIP SNW domain-containing protein n=1 Tax=Galdieria sulphuraria TaxID=130081 RepID=M2X8I6_GALSU|nr:uncharacterized protein Gasu_02210 [Galdieria sulphuraria]EME32870.1 hypothetical protein Gasu_02210 [Galdieria sulphuraria]GJD05735.1 SNW/SKI-interacting protein [Galdieria sulphuraria]|eukprot:XP_005709390.1 hypothetical protein Gasu_02210 [Galdieria sulphuraria]
MTSLLVSNARIQEVDQTPQKKNKETVVPEYPHRTENRFIPRSEEDFEDGGAYPEVHVFQYPANMGLKHKYKSSVSHRTLVPTVDAKGEVDYDAVVKQGENKTKIVHTGYESLREKPRVETQVQKPDEEQILETTQRTQQALEKIVQAKINASKPKSFEGERDVGKPTFIRYTPANSDDGHNSGAKQRIIKLVEAPVDPLEPPRFQHKKTPAAPPSPPVPILHSPPRKLDPEEAANWKIPPCISNWKNNKGYTIPLDKRVAADGRGLQDVRINDKFAKFTESLYIAERNAREEVEKRAQLQKKLAEKEKEKREMELRELATRARNERVGMYTEEGRRNSTSSIRESSATQELERDISDSSLTDEVGGHEELLDEKEYTKMTKEEQREYRKRQQIREERRRERQRQLRLWEKEEELGRSGKRSKLARDQDRDISEKIALNQPIVNNVRGEVQYDQRLFNQSSGLDRGFGAEDSYNVYDKPLFSGGSGASLIRPSRTAVDSSYTDQLGSDASSKRQFHPDIGFHSTESQDAVSGKERTKPVEFEHDELTSIRPSGKVSSQEADPLGLEAFLTEAKRVGSRKDANASSVSRPNIMSYVGSSDPSGLQEEYKYRGGSHRSKIHFQSAKNE